jgi:hypothetical protein
MFDTILEQVEKFLPIEDYVLDGLDFFFNLSYLEQLIGVVVLAIVVLMGVWALIKTLSKLIIVVGVIAGLWFLYSSGALDQFIG